MTADSSLGKTFPDDLETDFKALYAEAVAASTEALAASRARDAALAMVGHDLRNPLNAIATSAEVLKRALPGSREAASAADVIGRQVSRLAQLINLHLPAIGLPGSAPVPASTASQTSRIGVIDDNEDASFSLCSILELDGHEVRTATDGPDGLAMLMREAPDVAIVDIGLPGFDGCELARRCRALGYRGRLIAISGYGRQDDVQRSLAAGFEAHLVKPFEAERLARMLRRPAAGRHAPLPVPVPLPR